MIASAYKQDPWHHSCMIAAPALAVCTDLSASMANTVISANSGSTLNIGSGLDLCNSPGHCKVASYITFFHLNQFVGFVFFHVSSFVSIFQIRRKINFVPKICCSVQSTLCNLLNYGKG